MPSSFRKQPGWGCVEFLQWALPQMGYAWPGFRRVRHRVCKRIGRRLRDLHLGDLESYRRHLEAHRSEWRVLDGFCGIPISRFGRDWRVFDCLGQEVLPRLAQAAADRGAERVEAWSIGCARGEEPYTVSAVWELMVAPSWPQLSIAVLGTDVDEEQLRRGRSGCFKASSLRELPATWRDVMFERDGTDYRIGSRFSTSVRFVRQDVREAMPGMEFDLILCRNLVLTYFSDGLRDQVLGRLAGALREGGAFVSGARERLPESCMALVPWRPELGIYGRSSPPEA